jgi:TDG/mug DNA glycosylase family protein
VRRPHGGRLRRGRALTSRKDYLSEDHRRVLELGIGLTELVKRWSRSTGELNAEDFRRGIPALTGKLQEVAPRVVAFNGKTAYARFCGRTAALGWQKERMAGARVFVLPSTAGANTSLTHAAKLRHFRRLARSLKGNGEH